MCAIILTSCFCFSTKRTDEEEREYWANKKAQAYEESRNSLSPKKQPPRSPIVSPRSQDFSSSGQHKMPTTPPRSKPVKVSSPLRSKTKHFKSQEDRKPTNWKSLDVVLDTWQTSYATTKDGSTIIRQICSQCGTKARVDSNNGVVTLKGSASQIEQTRSQLDQMFLHNAPEKYSLQYVEIWYCLRLC